MYNLSLNTYIILDLNIIKPKFDTIEKSQGISSLSIIKEAKFGTNNKTTLIVLFTVQAIAVA